MRFVTCIVRECQLRLCGHVAHFPDADPAHQILSSRKPRDWRRPMGQPCASLLHYPFPSFSILCLSILCHYNFHQPKLTDKIVLIYIFNKVEHLLISGKAYIISETVMIFERYNKTKYILRSTGCDESHEISITKHKEYVEDHEPGIVLKPRGCVITRRHVAQHDQWDEQSTCNDKQWEQRAVLSWLEEGETKRKKDKWLFQAIGTFFPC